MHRRRRRGGGWLYQLLRVFFFTHAASRGPRYLVTYELRRQARRAVYKSTRRW